MARVLRALRTGYYEWRSHECSARDMANARLLESIVKIYGRCRGTYGAPRITRVLRDESGCVPRIHELTQSYVDSYRLLGLGPFPLCPQTGG